MSETLTLDLDGEAVVMLIRRSSRARRMSLKVEPAEGVVLVLPPRATAQQGVAFAHANAGWVREHLKALPERIPFAPGALIPLLGEDHVLRHQPESRRGVWTEAGFLNVSGRIEHFRRRVGDFLKTRARREIAGRAHALAQHLGHRVSSVRLRDTRTRWGSCSARGDLAFSWRLVLAPLSVAEYVIAHEVAHLEQLNHSPAFWRVVASLHPAPEAARVWLKRHGARLHRYG